MRHNWMLWILMTASTSVWAEETLLIDETAEEEPKPPLTTEVEFGFQAHSGNTDTQALNALLGLEYIQGRHRTNASARFYNRYEDSEEDKRYSTYTAQTDYKLGPKSYLYGNFQGIDSLYSAYFKDFTLSVGMGYQFSYSEELKIEAELGPGYRYQEPNLDEIDDDDIIFPEIVQEAIVRGKLSISWDILENLNVSGELVAISGKSNTRLDSDFSVSNKVTDNIALKLAYSRVYHDRVPNGLEKADSVFSTTLHFEF